LRARSAAAEAWRGRRTLALVLVGPRLTLDMEPEMPWISVTGLTGRVRISEGRWLGLSGAGVARRFLGGGGEAGSPEVAGAARIVLIGIGGKARATMCSSDTELASVDGVGEFDQVDDATESAEDAVDSVCGAERRTDQATVGGPAAAKPWCASDESSSKS